MKFIHIKDCDGLIGKKRGLIIGLWDSKDKSTVVDVSLLISFKTKKFEYWLRIGVDYEPKRLYPNTKWYLRATPFMIRGKYSRKVSA